ncbi:MAG: LCP family protein [Clostridia bacterium]|nr:LCP family protein [Clostridia bacterium]
MFGKKKSKKQQKTAHRFWKIFCIVVLTIFGIGAIGAALIIGSVHNLLGSINYDTNSDAPTLNFDNGEFYLDDNPIDLSNLEVRGNTKSVTNYLLLGVDSRDGSFYGRSDTMMIASLDKKNKKVKLITLMRDTWASIPDEETGSSYTAKLNAAYAYGGFDLLSKTIEKNFCLDIDEYIAVNFDSFCEGVDAFGGVDMELDDRVVTWIPKEDPGNPDKFAMSKNFKQIRTPIGYTAGTYHLQGFQALAFCRVRYAYPDSDFSRQKNQRKVVGALIDKAKTSGPIKLYSVMKKVLPYVTTNVPQKEIEKYITGILGYRGYTVEVDYHLPDSGEYVDEYINGGAGLSLLDHEATVKKLHEYIYG